MPSGPRKAALLLSCLDANTAGELLKSAPPSVVKRIVKEMSALQKEGDKAMKECEDMAREFTELVDHGPSGGAGFLKQVLQNALGEQKYLEVLDEVKQDTFDKDPFQKIRDADPGKLTMALQGESPQVVGIVLAELDGDTSMTLLGQLDADTRDDVVKSMTFGQNVAAETRTRIAGVIDKRLKELDDEGVEAGAANPQLQKYRRVAVMIRGLGNELRMKMLDDLAKTNKEAAEGVSKMMVIWEDMATVPDRAMAEVLRGINSKKLALALVDADADTTKKMRENISERASAMLDEEADLLTNPKPTEVDAAREEVLEALRELNSQGFVY